MAPATLPASIRRPTRRSYLRAELFTDDRHVYARLSYDFATIAEKLTAWSDGIVAAEEIETYRERVGDVRLENSQSRKPRPAPAPP